MKKAIASVLAASMALSLAACGGSSTATSSSTATESTASSTTAESTASGDKVTLRMTYWNSEDTVKALLDYLGEAVPDVQIEYQFIDNSNYDTIVDTQLSAGEGPDIICESPASALKHAKLGYLADVSDLGAKFSDAGTSVYSYDGKTYALPGISWFEGIYYNVDLFEQNNIALPTTFDEYLDVCKKFQDLGIKPLAAGLKSWEPMLKNSMAFVTAEYLSTDEGKDFGGKYREGQATLNGTWNPYLEKWSEMITSGVYTTDMTGIDHDQALEEFATGNAAMFCSGPWDLEAIQSKNPDLNLNMMPFYGTKASAGWLIGGPGCGFAVNENSANKEAALKVLAAIATEEGQKALWENNQGGSSYMSGVSFDLPEVYSSVSEEPGKLLRIQRCRRNRHFQVGPVRQQVFQVAEDEVDVQRPFVRLVDDQRLVPAQAPVVAGLGQQDAVGHELQHGRTFRAVVETDLIADFVPQVAAELLGRAPRHGRCREPARLGAADAPGPAVPERERDLRQLGGFAAAGIAGDDDDLIVPPRLFDLIDVAGDRQLFRERDPELFAARDEFGARYGVLHADGSLFERCSHASSISSSPSPP